MLKLNCNEGLAFEKMAPKANGISVKNKTEPQESIIPAPYSEAALFCLAYGMQL